MRSRTQTVIALLLLSLVAAARPANWGPAKNLIPSLPGYYSGSLPSELYGGYQTVGGTKKLFYLLSVSQADPGSNPLVVWLNGGPLCSSLYGWFSENGPFVWSQTLADPQKASPLLLSAVNATDNPHAWNKGASMLYIDSPAGTGLSFSTDPKTDYNCSDFQTAADLLTFLQSWFADFPKFAGNSFYLAGESYAGVYIPLLAANIVSANKNASNSPINLQGYLIGNPSTDTVTDNYDIFSTYAFDALIPPEMQGQLAAANCGTLQDPLNSDTYTFSSHEHECAGLTREANEKIQYVNAYAVNDDCFYGNQRYERHLLEEMNSRLKAEGFPEQERLYAVDDYCEIDARALTYFFNEADVRTAIHAAPPQSGNGLYLQCTYRPEYHFQVNSTIPYHSALLGGEDALGLDLATPLRALIYSGTTDTVVPYEGTELWTRRLGEKLGSIAPWTPWFYGDAAAFGSQTGGFIQQYEGLTFMTVRGAGHEVPFYRPKAAFAMFSAWLSGNVNATTVPVFYTHVED